MRKVTLPELTTLAWEMITTHHRAYYPGELIDPMQLNELTDEILNPTLNARPVNDIPVFYFRIDPEDSREQATHEFRYSIIQPWKGDPLYFIHQ